VKATNRKVNRHWDLAWSGFTEKKVPALHSPGRDNPVAQSKGEA